MKRAVVLSIFVLIFTISVFAGTVSHQVTVPQPRIDLTDDGHRIVLDQAMSTGQIGDPRLPVWGMNLLLPPGEKVVSVSVEAGDPVSLGTGFQVPPVQRQYPLSFNGPAVPDAPNAEVYEADALFPSVFAASFSTDFYRGYGIAAIALNPVRYNPVTGELVYYPNLTVTVMSAPDAAAMDARTTMLKRDSRTLERLSGQVDNPSDLSIYGGVDNGTDEPYYDILLITHELMVGWWDEYVAWKTKCGYYVAIETVQDIYTTYPGIDNPEKIRNCVIDYYQNYDLTYVFLAGDDEVIPHRGLYNSSGYTDNDIAGDIYFSGLDGTWNDDGDTHWGEENEADLRAEVYVSRGAVDSETEAANFVNKQLMYAREPVVDEVETGLMVGEDLGWPIWAWEYKEEVRLGTSSWGFQTEPFPADWDVRTLYETPGQSWSGTGDLIPLLNGGPLYVNHLGHADVGYMMQLYNNNLTNTTITNNGIDHNFYLVYSQGCYCGSFDNRTTGGSYTDDCISEQFSVLEGGAVAVVTNSRYGWGNLSTTQGSSQYYDKQFFDAIWGEGITFIAETNADSKHDCIPYIDYNQNRWCYYQLNAFAEPTLDLWTDEPTTMTASYAAAVMLGAASIQVTVPGLEGAMVCLSMNGTIHGVDYTDASGICTLILSEPLLTLGDADLVITAHDYLPHEGLVTVIPPSGPYVIFSQAEIDDQTANNNGQWDYGESVLMDLTVDNVGVDDAENVVVNLSSEDELVTVTGENIAFGTIAQGAGGTVAEAFGIEVDYSVEDGHFVPFTLEATDGIDTWESYFSLQVFAPEVVFAGMEVDDSVTGNGNGCLDPGETATLNVTLCNEGGCYTTGLDAVLGTGDTYITVTASTSAYGQIEGGGGTVSASFEITVSTSCPQEHDVLFALDYDDDIGYAGGDEFATVVGDITYDPTGPDAYGYFAYDPNDLPEMPVYDWVEISPDSGGAGDRIDLTLDDQVLHFALPFDFQYYGLTYDSITVSSNGWLGMGVILEDDYSNSAIPNSDGPAPMIAAYWEDMSPQRTNSGGVWQWYDEANNCFIIEFNHVEQYSPTGDFETFQTIFFDPAHYQTSTGDGRILVNYKDMSESALSDEGTFGIENQAETIGIQYSYDGDCAETAMPIQNGMCVLYSTPLGTPELTVTLTPENPPIVIPVGGGSFDFNIAIANEGENIVVFDVWSMITLPDLTEYGPLLLRSGLNLNPGGSIGRDLTQNIPGGAPEGSYSYDFYAGNYTSGMILSDDSFPFDKTGVDADGSVDNWNIYGWDGQITVVSTLPENFELKQNYPNPFNPITTIEYSLPEAAKVKLTVFNTLGQQAAVLVDGYQQAGYKTVEFEASVLSSGIYFYRIEAGDFVSMKKMILIK